MIWGKKATTNLPLAFGKHRKLVAPWQAPPTWKPIQAYKLTMPWLNSSSSPQWFWEVGNLLRTQNHCTVRHKGRFREYKELIVKQILKFYQPLRYSSFHISWETNRKDRCQILFLAQFLWVLNSPPLSWASSLVNNKMSTDWAPTMGQVVR